MTAESSTIYLLEVATGASIEAELLDAIEDRHLADWHTEWQPALLEVLRELRAKGVPVGQWPQSRHWNWRDKMSRVQGLLGFKGFSITAGGMTQGLMKVDLMQGARIEVQQGKPLVYVDYLEAAPWNRPDLGQKPKFKGVGTALVSAAVALSSDEGFGGRIALHSLPQSDRFYLERCGMTDLGPDPAYQNLRYFEFTSDQARTFLEEEE
jgi:hypothetical protein